MSIQDKFSQLAGKARTAALLAPVQPFLDKLDSYLREQVGAFEPEVQPLVTFTLGHSGKKIRPILVFLGGWQGKGVDVPPSLLRAAAIMEMVHLATLVHDDILDEADTRHEVETVTARFGPHAAVLLGDALFAHALKLAADFPTPEVCRIVAESTRQVCSGEIAQTFARNQDHLTLERYLRMIDLKTAELFASSARLGAFLGNYSPDVVDAIETFARKLGIAYQIYDDLADLIGDQQRAGKTLGTDLASGKRTLPVFYWLEGHPKDQHRQLWEALKTSPPAEIRQNLIDSGAVQRTIEKIEDLLNEAKATLETIADAPPSEMLPPLTGWLRDALARLTR